MAPNGSNEGGATLIEQVFSPSGSDLRGLLRTLGVLAIVLCTLAAGYVMWGAPKLGIVPALALFVGGLMQGALLLGVASALEHLADIRNRLPKA